MSSPERAAAQKYDIVRYGGFGTDPYCEVEEHEYGDFYKVADIDPLLSSLRAEVASLRARVAGMEVRVVVAEDLIREACSLYECEYQMPEPLSVVGQPQGPMSATMQLWARMLTALRGKPASDPRAARIASLEEGLRLTLRDLCGRMSQEAREASPTVARARALLQGADGGGEVR